MKTNWECVRRDAMNLILRTLSGTSFLPALISAQGKDAYLRDPKHASTMRAKGLEPLPGAPADAVRFQNQEQAKWGRVVNLVRAKGRLS
ncbi:hypothetical protein [Acidovorax sp. Leaf73]|uniref:hypothetical protein n=1 Tax=Acidovorax sp. Leaf73 TaxID=2876566 RepID=UPI001E3FA58C|nr:hypothetical protein [Acidovorax sp. Leaf73]